MAWTKDTLDTIARLDEVKRTLNEQFVDREVAIDLLILAAVCQEHLLLIGSPGTAKTQICSCFTQLVEARDFHYLLTRFTEPSELFGPLDLPRFEEGEYHIRTDGMLPQAQIAFLDEVFQGSSAILNTLLTLINERVFHNGSNREAVPLISLIGASNLLPDDPWLCAFADRFALRLHLEPVADERLERLIDRGWELELQRIEDQQRAHQGQPRRQVAALKVDKLLGLHGRLAEVDMAPLRPVYAATVRELRAQGVELSDRRAIKGLKLAAGHALLRKAEVAEPQDLWPLIHVWSRTEEAEAARAVIQPKLEEAGGRTLTRARLAADLLEDIAVLEAQSPNVRTEIAIGAHLMALSRLRQEILRDHRPNTDLRQRIEVVIRDDLGRLEAMQHV
jgi:MoxR-like ATPase